MRKSLITLVAASSVAAAAVTAPTAAEARWRGWGWGAALGGFEEQQPRPPPVAIRFALGGGRKMTCDGDPLS